MTLVAYRLLRQEVLRQMQCSVHNRLGLMIATVGEDLGGLLFASDAGEVVIKLIFCVHIQPRNKTLNPSQYRSHIGGVDPAVALAFRMAQG